ncbi:Hypothetical predicted protein [Paramuricea clavata]|uniref:Uncharacterized protein n=1 Tax=Paramuricea clavata TaxID=317549 RepID=A0A6S7H3Y7_PARCT|nr:Hypothetical predicted protein [Paramuricea clavata]
MKSKEGKQRSIFLVSVGAKTYKLIRSLVAPEEPKSKSYEELAKLVQDHYQRKPNGIVERFKFNTCCQQQAEPKLTLKRALDLAIAIETSEKDALNLQKNNTPGANGMNKRTEQFEFPRDKTLVVGAVGVMGTTAPLKRS